MYIASPTFQQGFLQVAAAVCAALTGSLQAAWPSLRPSCSLSRLPFEIKAQGNEGHDGALHNAVGSKGGGWGRLG
jgi:hypothetical protein